MRQRSIASSNGPGTAGPSNPAQTRLPAERRPVESRVLTPPSLGGHRLRGRRDALARGTQRHDIAFSEAVAEDRPDRADDVRGGSAERAPAVRREHDELATPVTRAGTSLDVPAFDQAIQQPSEPALGDEDAFGELGRPQPVARTGGHVHQHVVFGVRDAGVREGRLDGERRGRPGAQEGSPGAQLGVGGPAALRGIC